MSSDLPQALTDLQDRGFVIAHEVLDRVSEDEDTAVVFDLSDGLAAGGKVLLVRASGEWEVLIEVGHGNFWLTYSVCQAMRGQLSAEPPYMQQTHQERQRLTVQVLDRLHCDPDARREVLETARRWTQREPSD